MKALKKYKAFFFKQRNEAPLLASFVSTSPDIWDWATTPSKKSENLRNFQRPLIEGHMEEIYSYFETYRENCSPTSIVIGFSDLTSITCEDCDGNKLDSSTVPEGEIIEGTININFDDPNQIDELNETEKSDFISIQIENLIKSNTEKLQESLDETSTDEFLNYAESNKQEQSDEELDGDDTLENELGVPVETTTELNISRANFILKLKSALKDISQNPDSANKYLETISATTKPGLIIDGQHRITGTKDTDIPFSVIAMPEAGWDELAFQFMVLNLSARKVPENLLINIIGNSLDEKELSNIEKRLNSSGIPVAIYQGIMDVHENPDSPFYKMLNFGLPGDSGVIAATAIKNKVITPWYNCDWYSLLKHLLKGKNKTEKLQDWQSKAFWKKQFFEFWNLAKEQYENDDLWTKDQIGGKPTSKLMMAGVLGLVQDTFMNAYFEHIKNTIEQDATGTKTFETELPDFDTLTNQMRFYFQKLKGSFFTEWNPNATGFQGSASIAGILVDAIQKVLKGTPIATLKSKTQPKNAHELFRTPAP